MCQECDWPSEDEDEEELAENVKEKAKVVDQGDVAKDEGKEGELEKGVPGFWLTIFKNVEMLAEMVQVMIRMYWQYYPELDQIRIPMSPCLSCYKM